MERFINELIEKEMFQLEIHVNKAFDALHGHDYKDPVSYQYTIPKTSLPRDTSHGEASPLCDACSSITIEALESQTGYLHSKDFESILQSAENCALCSLILRSMRTAVKFHARNGEDITDAGEALDIFACFMAEKHNMYLLNPTPVILRLDDTRLSPIARYVSIGTVTMEPSDDAPRIGLAFFWGRLLLHNNRDSIEPLRPRGNEDEVMDRLADWLRARESEVPSWSNAGGDKPLPTRVLDLDCFGATQQDGSPADIRLVQTLEGQCGRYVTLSYCWGGYTGCRTLKANLDKRLERIPFRNLPEVFAHAVRVTRGLGIRYLWIDALCIIQDDFEDWKREAATMCDVYWNTVCRLAVTDSKNPTEGFFPPSPILASVRVPSLEKGAQGQGRVGDEWYDPEESKDQHEKGKSVDNDKDVITTSIATENMSEEGEKLDDENMHLTTFSRGKRREDEKDEAWPTSEGTMSEETQKRSPPHGYDGSSNDPSLHTMDDFWAKFMRELNKQECEKTPQDRLPLEMFLTLPRAYAVDVDRGHLNTRGWVLQERLLAPRTIHFTKEHIYCEDQEDICGEDWVRRYFAWRSSINKESTHTTVELFPERKFHTPEHFADNLHNSNLWLGRSQSREADNQFVPDPWLRICEIFSCCKFSYNTDKLAAIAGLVKKKQELARSGEARNFFGLWEESLHEELAWVAHPKGKVKFLHSLHLPSWAWIAYEGQILFTNETRHFRDPRRIDSPPKAEFQLLEANVPDITATLPLQEQASLMLDITVRKLNGIFMESAKTREHDASNEQREASLPYSLDPRSRKVPVPLLDLSVCREIHDLNQGVIGFASFDEDIPHTNDIYCAHISTLIDDTYLLNTSDGEESKPGGKLNEPILAFALLIVKVNGTACDYRRIGLAQLNHGWITSGIRQRVRLV